MLKVRIYLGGGGGGRYNRYDHYQPVKLLIMYYVQHQDQIPARWGIVLVPGGRGVVRMRDMYTQDRLNSIVVW